MAEMSITSSAFEDGEPIPEKYSQDGRNVSPPLSWDGVPDGARELALIVDDPDAPMDQPFVHWVIYNIPADATGLPEGVPQGATVSEPQGAVQGVNTAGNQGYDGPKPPHGHGTHHYYFKLRALDAKLDLGPGRSKADLNRAMEGHVLAEAELVGTYER